MKKIVTLGAAFLMIAGCSSTPPDSGSPLAIKVDPKAKEVSKDVITSDVEGEDQLYFIMEEEGVEAEIPEEDGGPQLAFDGADEVYDPVDDAKPGSSMTSTPTLSAPKVNIPEGTPNQVAPKKWQNEPKRVQFEPRESERDSRKSARKVASKGGFFRMAKNCRMRQRPTTESQSVGTVNRGKRLWVDPHNDDWVKIYRKGGPAYISQSCL